jgi:hypothetical protein
MQNIIRASRSHILRMLLPKTSRLVSVVFMVLLSVLLLSVPGKAQNFAGMEEQLARRIVSATGPKTIAVEVVNRSSLYAAVADDIRRNLLTQLAILGVHFVGADQASSNVRVSLSENLQSYLWLAEIRQGTNSPTVAMISLPRTAPLSIEPPATAMVLRKTLLWSEQERILDVAVIDDNPSSMFVLDPNGVSTYRSQDGHWQLERSQPVAHSRPWPRDLRGRLVPGRDRDKDKDKDHFFDVYLPGVHCRGSAGSSPALTCSDSDEPWPLAPDSNLSAFFTPSRNYFNGGLSTGVGKISTVPAFYSAAPTLRDQSVWWLLAAVNGEVHLLDGETDQVLDKSEWGSDIAAVRSSCGSGWQIIASEKSDNRNDGVRAFEVIGREPVPASASLEMNGTITALWTESSGVSAVAVVRNLETGRYEAFRLTLTCGR